MSSQPPSQGPPPPAGPGGLPPGSDGPASPGTTGPSRGVVAAIVLGVLVVVGGGVTAAVLLIGGDGESGDCALGASMAGCVEPTDEPMAEPSDEPTEEPTAEPSDEPTEEPTGEPVEPDGEPAVAVQEFIDAVRDDDCETAIAFLTEDLVKKQDASCDDFDTSGMDQVEYGTPSVRAEDDKTATVEQLVTMAEVDQELTLVYEMVNEDGRWLIDDFGPETASATPTP